jgi:membrane associated rhomboid family serine protease
LLGGLAAMLAQVAADPHSTVPNLGASGAIAAVMGAFMVTYPRDQIKSILFIFVFARIKFVPAALLIGVWFLSQLSHAGAVAHTQTGGVAYLAAYRNPEDDIVRAMGFAPVGNGEPVTSVKAPLLELIK